MNLYVDSFFPFVLLFINNTLKGRYLGSMNKIFFYFLINTMTLFLPLEGNDSNLQRVLLYIYSDYFWNPSSF